ncbi:MAG: IS1096 element passenger TnpR family protein, partial [Acidiferrobacteraceae bacterium]
PEDCGGPWGYEHLLEALRDPKHEDHEPLREWIGGEFDPEAFDLDEVNRMLKRAR